MFNPGFWGFVVLAVVTAVVLRRTVFGRYVYAVGSSEADGPAVRRAGRPGQSRGLHDRRDCWPGWAAFCFFAHGGAGDPSGAEGRWNCEVIAAVVIGGASLTAGRGTVLGTVLGVLTLEVA